MQQLNVITFDDPMRAQELLLAMTRLASHGHLQLQDAVFVTKTEEGRVRVHETSDLTPGEGALSGGFWGLLFGTLLLGPAGGLAVGAASAGTGALMGKLIDAGVHDDFVAQIKAEVEPGRTALILLTEGGDATRVEAELERFAGARLLWSNLPPAARREIEAALDAGHAHHDVDITAEHPAADTGA